VDGVDDLGVVEALQVNRCDAEVAVPELALDDDERHTFASHLDGMGMAKLMSALTVVRRFTSLRVSSSSDAAEVVLRS
jgi:hypothetical protein